MRHSRHSRQSFRIRMRDQGHALGSSTHAILPMTRLASWRIGTELVSIAENQRTGAVSVPFEHRGFGDGYQRFVAELTSLSNVEQHLFVRLLDELYCERLRRKQEPLARKRVVDTKNLSTWPCGARAALL